MVSTPPPLGRLQVALPTDVQPGLVSILLIVGRGRVSLVFGIQDVPHTT